jgi:hypothetical protein
MLRLAQALVTIAIALTTKQAKQKAESLRWFQKQVQSAGRIGLEPIEEILAP